MGGDGMRRLINLLESIEWRGTADGAREAGDKGHTMDDARAYIRRHYPLTKTYWVRRAEPGFRALDRSSLLPDPAAMKSSMAQMNDTDRAVAQLGLRRNAMMSGSDQVSYSIGWSWHVSENPEHGRALLYYQDRGMGHDRITLAARDPAGLAVMVRAFRDAGIIASPASRDRSLPDAQSRMDQLQADGMSIARIKDPTPEERLAALRQNGRAIQFIKDPTPEERLVAIRQDPWAISLVAWPTPREIDLARQQGISIRGRRLPRA